MGEGDSVGGSIATVLEQPYTLFEQRRQMRNAGCVEAVVRVSLADLIQWDNIALEDHVRHSILGDYDEVLGYPHVILDPSIVIVGHEPQALLLQVRGRIAMERLLALEMLTVGVKREYVELKASNLDPNPDLWLVEQAVQVDYSQTLTPERLSERLAAQTATLSEEFGRAYPDRGWIVRLLAVPQVSGGGAITFLVSAYNASDACSCIGRLCWVVESQVDGLTCEAERAVRVFESGRLRAFVDTDRETYLILEDDRLVESGEYPDVWRRLVALGLLPGEIT